MSKQKSYFYKKDKEGNILPRSRTDIPGVLSGAGGRACMCPTCKEVFSSISAFEAHRKLKGRMDNYHRVCLNPESVGLIIGKRNLWISDQERDFDGEPETS